MSAITRQLLMVYLALMLLLVLTVLLSFCTLGAWSAPISLLIAAAKAFLVLFYFMKLKESSNSLRIMALGALFWLLILLSLTASDYLTRNGST